jgi:hypothetical protein
MAIPIRVKKEIPPTHPGAVLRGDIMPDYGFDNGITGGCIRSLTSND